MEGQIKIIKVEFHKEQDSFLKLCNLHYKKLIHIFASGIMEIKGGRAIIDFDDGNNISNIKKESNYNPKKEKLGVQNSSLDLLSQDSIISKGNQF